ncbi:hypothetical protein [Streptomyces arenae]|uniref:hypothetical protein n=1 Tax=Streptomyces arenae TaxID=29301 RepID=UPI002658CF2A|nr:hypothetical protein [Streptomyces arenae]MCG7211010.1 hypothetical protein [Streptomyces arenae]
MGRRGGPRSGVTALGLGLALLTGCGAATAPATPTAPTAAQDTPAGSQGGSQASSQGGSPSAVSDADLCARIVAHWAREVLGSGTYGDYQSMGLSNGQYEILRDVVDAARALKRRQGAAAADRLIDRRARSACAERYRRGTPSGGPWR